MKIKTYEDEMTGETSVMATFSRSELYKAELEYGVMQTIVNQIAELVVKEVWPGIMSKIDQQAIANLALAKAANKIGEKLNEY